METFRQLRHFLPALVVYYLGHLSGVFMNPLLFEILKFKEGQKVWMMDQNRPIEISVCAFKVECTYKGYSSDWGGMAYPIEQYFSSEGYGKVWIHESKLFSSKEELLKSL